MSSDDSDPDRLRRFEDHRHRPLHTGREDERRYRERYAEKTVRGVTVATLVDRYNDDAWIRSTVAVEVEP